MEVVFSFDTEDYYRPESDDALLALARSHTFRRAPACFGIVGEKARFLRNNGRRDVIEALREHEIGYHSDHHFTLPDPSYTYPCLPEHLERTSWDEGLARLLAEESRGVHDVVEAFGVRPVTWLRNYGDYAPQYAFAFSRLGLGVYAYGPAFRGGNRPYEDAPWRPVWYANLLSIGGPRMTYEEHLHDALSPEEKLAAYKAIFTGHLEAGTPRLNVVTHPTQFCSEAWPLQAFFGQAHPPRAAWSRQATPCYPRAKREALLAVADAFIAFVAAHPDARIRTFRDLWEEYGTQPAWVSAPAISRLARAVLETGLRWQHDGAATFSPAELFALFAQAIAEPGRGEYVLRHPAGPVEEPRPTPPGLRLDRAAFLAACRRVEDSLRDRDRVPAAVDLDGAFAGPGSFLAAMARALAEPRAARIDLPPVENRPRPLQPDDYQRLAAGVPARLIQQGDFMGLRLREDAQRQYWTVKPARPE